MLWVMGWRRCTRALCVLEHLRRCGGFMGTCGCWMLATVPPSAACSSPSSAAMRPGMPGRRRPGSACCARFSASRACRCSGAGPPRWPVRTQASARAVPPPCCPPRTTLLWWCRTIPSWASGPLERWLSKASWSPLPAGPTLVADGARPTRCRGQRGRSGTMPPCPARCCRRMALP